MKVLTEKEVLHVEETYGTPSPIPNTLSHSVQTLHKSAQVSDFEFTGEFRPPNKGDFFVSMPSEYSKQKNLCHIEAYVYNFNIGPRLILRKKGKGK